MDPVTPILIPGILGGLAIAWLISRRQGHRPHTLADPPKELSISTDAINIAHIRAAGLGGLGLFAMAIAVAFFVPRIGQTVSVGVLLGVLLAVLLILRRRRDGPLPSSGGSAGANVVLSIDHPVSPENENTDGKSNSLRHRPVCPARLSPS